MASALLLAGVVVAVALVRAYAGTSERFVIEWAAAHGLALTAGNRPMVWWYLRNAGVLRTLGVLGGLLLPPLVGLAVTGSPRAVGGLLWAFAGYLVGALYAELSLVRPRGDGRRVAVLSSREVEQYLPRRILLAQRAVAAVGALALLGVTLLPYETLGSQRAYQHAALPLAAAGAVVVGLALPVVQRWLVQRPQPWTDPDLVAADDAIRSQSLHSVAGSGLAVALTLVGPPLWAVSQADVAGLDVLMYPALLSLPAAWVACLYYGHRAWRVPRPRPPRPTPVGAP